MDTVAIFCAIDDFCKLFEPHWRQVYWQRPQNSVTASQISA
jgi:hypothetical protein